MLRTFRTHRSRRNVIFTSETAFPHSLLAMYEILTFFSIERSVLEHQIHQVFFLSRHTVETWETRAMLYGRFTTTMRSLQDKRSTKWYAPACDPIRRRRTSREERQLHCAHMDLSKCLRLRVTWLLARTVHVQRRRNIFYNFRGSMNDAEQPAYSNGALRATLYKSYECL